MQALHSQSIGFCYAVHSSSSHKASNVYQNYMINWVSYFLKYGQISGEEWPLISDQEVSDLWYIL